MKVLQTRTFIRAAKKLQRNQISALKNAIETITRNPPAGDLKKGDLAGVRVYKFRMLHQLILLAYYFDENVDTLTLLAFDPHENFYDTIKKRLN